MHTPGPWTRKRPIPEDDTVSRLVFAGDDLIATVHDLEDASREAIANARLIAAAPSLLFALREAQAYLDGEDVSRYAIEAVIRSAIQFATKD